MGYWNGPDYVLCHFCLVLFLVVSWVSCRVVTWRDVTFLYSIVKEETKKSIVHSSILYYINPVVVVVVVVVVSSSVCGIFSTHSSLSFCCSSQVKCCRYTNGFCLAFGLVVVQACTFLVYGSKFCQEHNCTFSRSAGYSIGAIVCYLIAGVAFFVSKDYPGENNINHHNDENVQDVTKGIVYHDDPELNPTDMEEAHRISQLLGTTTTSGANLLPPPPDAGYDNHYNEKSEESTWTTHDVATPPVVATVTADDTNVYNDDDERSWIISWIWLKEKRGEKLQHRKYKSKSHSYRTRYVPYLCAPPFYRANSIVVNISIWINRMNQSKKSLRN